MYISDYFRGRMWNVIINIVIIITFCFKIPFSNKKKYEELKVNKNSVKPKNLQKNDGMRQYFVPAILTILQKNKITYHSATPL